MLICIDEKREVIWHNEEIPKEESTKYLSENVFWFDTMPIPETPPLLQNETAELYLSAENILHYKKIEKVLPVPEPTLSSEELQAEILLNQQQIITRQNTQEAVLAQLLLNQQGGSVNV